DIGNHRIRKIDAQTGVITSIAGNDEKKLPVAGQQAEGNSVLGPRALIIADDVLWVALREGHSLWKIKLAEGKWEPVAGTGKKGFSGDGGPAAEATFDGPKGIALGPDKNVYVVDTENHAIRLVDTKTGKISTIAGKGPKHKGSAGDGGPATEAQMD